MKLYDVPRNTTVRVVDTGLVLDFVSIDGMYSKCYDKDNNIVHPAAWTEVEIVKKGSEE
jgi:hypothetical protein